ncbi:hypothetical protein F5Y16DRAFT_424175 [Xylariaceae sp. FL0255]|nr:hypothetical protein F5Y16DRAFT_424175 [Xylariaceae sp. FL0255]
MLQQQQQQQQEEEEESVSNMFEALPDFFDDPILFESLTSSVEVDRHDGCQADDGPGSSYSPQRWDAHATLGDLPCLETCNHPLLDLDTAQGSSNLVVQGGDFFNMGSLEECGSGSHYIGPEATHDSMLLAPVQHGHPVTYPPPQHFMPIPIQSTAAEAQNVPNPLAPSLRAGHGPNSSRPLTSILPKPSSGLCNNDITRKRKRSISSQQQWIVTLFVLSRGDIIRQYLVHLVSQIAIGRLSQIVLNSSNESSSHTDTDINNIVKESTELLGAVLRVDQFMDFHRHLLCFLDVLIEKLSTKELFHTWVPLTMISLNSICPPEDHASEGTNDSKTPKALQWGRIAIHMTGNYHQYTEIKGVPKSQNIAPNSTRHNIVMSHLGKWEQHIYKSLKEEAHELTQKHTPSWGCDTPPMVVGLLFNNLEKNAFSYNSRQFVKENDDHGGKKYREGNSQKPGSNIIDQRLLDVSKVHTAMKMDLGEQGLQVLPPWETVSLEVFGRVFAFTPLTYLSASGGQGVIGWVLTSPDYGTNSADGKPNATLALAIEIFDSQLAERIRQRWHVELAIFAPGGRKHKLLDTAKEVAEAAQVIVQIVKVVEADVLVTRLSRELRLRRVVEQVFEAGGVGDRVFW